MSVAKSKKEDEDKLNYFKRIQCAIDNYTGRPTNKAYIIALSVMQSFEKYLADTRVSEKQKFYIEMLLDGTYTSLDAEQDTISNLVNRVRKLSESGYDKGKRILRDIAYAIASKYTDGVTLSARQLEVLKDFLKGVDEYEEKQRLKTEAEAQSRVQEI